MKPNQIEGANKNKNPNIEEVHKQILLRGQSFCK